MFKIRISAIASLIVLGATNILTAPDTVTYQLALPAIEASEVQFAMTNDNLEPKMVFVPTTFTTEDKECLAQNIYFEAKNQSIRGQLAVGIVTLKRVESSRFPDTICGAVKHTAHAYANGFPVRHMCQFSWYCDGLSDRPYNAQAYAEAVYVADALLSTESGFYDFTDGADHYHADYITPPTWTVSMRKVAQIEDHIFYTSSL